MAILHLRMHGPERGMSAVQRFDYLGAELPHFSRGKVEYAQSGNLPSFAEGSARDFWSAADIHERVNARVFIEIEAALPYELSPAQNEALAKAAAGDFFGNLFPYTMAIHSLLSAENKQQHHLHLMFCSRSVTDAARDCPQERFFKRNGARKDRSWNRRSRPMEIRTRWCVLLNAALVNAGIDEQFSPGKKDGKAEPKILGRYGLIDAEALREVKEMREARRDTATLIQAYGRKPRLRLLPLKPSWPEIYRNSINWPQRFEGLRRPPGCDATRKRGSSEC